MALDQGPEGTTSPEGKNLRRRRPPLDSVDGQIHVSRPAFTETQLRSKLSYAPPEEPSLLKSAAASARSCVSCSPAKLWALLVLRVPILGWLPRYDFKKNFFMDVIAGLTVGVMHLPQGMGYAMMAEVPPVLGLYTAIFPVLGYVVFGTSKHISMGTFAVGTLMTGKIVVALSSPTTNATMAANATLFAGNVTDVPHFTNIQVSMAAAFMVGVWQVIFAFLHLGKVSVLLPDMLVSGFTTGAAFHVFSSQIKYLLGIKLERHVGPFYLITLYKDTFKLLPSANITTLIVSGVSLTILGLYAEVFKPRLRKLTPIPIPVDLFALIIGTTVTKYCQLDKKHGLVVVGHIPMGLPVPEVPDYRLFRPMLLDSFVLAIIVYVICFTLAKIFAKKHGYKVESTQELYAGGLSNIFGSFFSIVPSCSSLSRSMVQEMAGGQTQVVSLVSMLVVSVVLMSVASFFETLPTAVLASIIMVALKGLFMHVFDFVEMLKQSKSEALLWMVTFLGVVVVDVDWGGGIGVIFNILLQFIRNNQPTITRLGWITKTDIYVDIDSYQSAVSVPGGCLCSVSGTLHSANVEDFREELVRVSGIDTTKLIKAKAKREKREKKERKKAARLNLSPNVGIPLDGRDQIVVIDNSNHNPRGQEIREELASMFRNSGSSSAFEDVQQTGVDRRGAEQGHDNRAYLHDDARVTDPDPKDRPSGLMKRLTQSAKEAKKPGQDVSFMVLSMSCVGWIDVTAAKDLGDLYKEHEDAGIVLALAGTNDSVMKMLLQSGVLAKIPEHCFFISLHDAVTSLVADVLNSKPQPSSFVGPKDGVQDLPPNSHDARRAVVPVMLNSQPRRPPSGLPAPAQPSASHLERHGMEGAAEDFEYYQAQRNYAQPLHHQEGRDARSAERKRTKNRGNNSHYSNSNLILQPRDSDYNTRF